MSKQTQWDLIALGLNAVDVLIRMPESIKHDDKQFVDNLTIQGGAPIGSGSCGVSRLGFTTGVIARLGDNTLSHVSSLQQATSSWIWWSTTSTAAPLSRWFRSTRSRPHARCLSRWITMAM